jgi:polyribonucleotide nucleotidyltransferase
MRSRPTSAIDLVRRYGVRDKLERRDAISALKKDVLAALGAGRSQRLEAGRPCQGIFRTRIPTMRARCLSTKVRIDGRKLDDVRASITIRVGVLPRTHGSALFTRGETQALVTVTLGTGRDAQIIDAVEGESKDQFLFHYNFPPYSVGEAGRMMGPKRREIGHGRLAKRGVLAVMPTIEGFPYVIRVVSEITESNGSSSMASVCGSSLAMMDAGVPLKAPVAGIAMGLVKEGNDFVVLSDILGDEDHLGDMDFKVAGSSDGIRTADGHQDRRHHRGNHEGRAGQAKAGRLHILGEMNKALSARVAEMSDFAPRLLTMKIHPDKIREVIGKGGSVIRSITEETGTRSTSGRWHHRHRLGQPPPRKAKSASSMITSDVEPGRIYEGKVAKLMDFGAFVTIPRARTAWCTSRRSPTSASRRFPTSSRKAISSRSRCWKSTSRAASACR